MVSMQGMALCLNSKKLLRLPRWVNTEEERHRIPVPRGWHSCANFVPLIWKMLGSVSDTATQESFN